MATWSGQPQLRDPHLYPHTLISLSKCQLHKRLPDDLVYGSTLPPLHPLPALLSSPHQARYSFAGLVSVRECPFPEPPPCPVTVCERPGLEFRQEPPTLARSLRPRHLNRQICDQSPQSHGRDAAPSGPAKRHLPCKLGVLEGPPGLRWLLVPRAGQQGTVRLKTCPGVVDGQSTKGWKSSGQLGGEQRVCVCGLGLDPTRSWTRDLKAGGCSEPQGVGGHRLGRAHSWAMRPGCQGPGWKWAPCLGC